MLYVVQTDALCRLCGDRHEYTTKGCQLQVYTDWATARMIARSVEGTVREIERVPEGIEYTLVTLVNGRPNPNAPTAKSRIAL